MHFNLYEYFEIKSSFQTLSWYQSGIEIPYLLLFFVYSSSNIFLFSLFFLNPSFSLFFLSLCFVHGFSNQSTSTNMESATRISFDQTQNPGSVYYIHPSDLSTLKLVTMPFNGTGFADWKRSIVIGLVSKNKLAFVDGSLPKSEDNSSNLKAWKRCNIMVIGWIILL